MTRTQQCQTGSTPSSVRFCTFLNTQDDDDDDDDTQKKSVQQSLEAWRYRRECRGHNPTKKSVRTGAACSGGKVCTCTRLNDSVQYIGSR